MPATNPTRFDPLRRLERRIERLELDLAEVEHHEAQLLDRIRRIEAEAAMFVKANGLKE